ncbi:MAG TPA: dihydroorotate dehydrogenase electron transfer subunit [Bacteroidetes bacterium]|nr:dihydroorotate dehydrogenase electron transfer subunit [Bacteroidota bacterium]
MKRAEPASKKYLGEYPLTEKEWLNASYYRLRFEAPEIARESLPGQFVNLRLTRLHDPLLRRPMSIFRRNAAEGWFEVLVKVVGKATKFFGGAHPGDRFDLLGPLGRGFRTGGVRRAVLVGGGIGIAPLVFLAEELRHQEVPVVFFQGFRSADEVCCTRELEQLGAQVILSTDDGTAGRKGLVSEVLEEELKNGSRLREADVFVCGPDAMMRSVAGVCRAYGLPAQISVEAHMACGFGACVGCAVPAADGQQYFLACVDGPVFDLKEISLGR